MSESQSRDAAVRTAVLQRRVSRITQYCPVYASAPTRSGKQVEVEMWRGGGRYVSTVGRPFRLAVSQSTNHNSVSTSRLSNRTGPIKASGSRTRHHAFAHGRLRVNSGSRMSPNLW